MSATNAAIETRLRALADYAFGQDAKRDEATLTSALADKSYRVIAKAAELAGERLCYGTMSALKDAYRRLLVDPIKKDPQCMAKQAIVRALVTLDCPDAPFFLAGLGYTQLEPVWGGSVDTAIDVRASCAMGLVNSGHPRALHEIVQLLHDSEPRARLGAVRAIACGVPSEAELLLRSKLLSGDQEPEVIGECFSALLTVGGADAVPVVARRLDDRDSALVEYAAIALGESQLPEALAALRAAWDAVFVSPERKRELARAAAVHRSDAAFAWLLSVIAAASMQGAEAALEALSIYKHNSALSARIKHVLAERGSAKLNERFATLWSDSATG